MRDRSNSEAAARLIVAWEAEYMTGARLRVCHRLTGNHGESQMACSTTGISRYVDGQQPSA
jgi:hypothetical protein